MGHSVPYTSLRAMTACCQRAVARAPGKGRGPAELQQGCRQYMQLGQPLIEHLCSHCPSADPRRMLADCPHHSAPRPPTPVHSKPLGARLQGWRSSQRRRCVRRAAKAAPARTAIPDTAKEAVETGLQLFQKGQTEDALRLFTAAADLQPKQEELRAAEYNKGCALVKLKRWQQASDAIVAAVNEHGEDIQTALKDPDLEPLRERREWLDAMDVLKGGVTSSGIVKLRTEARAPFRLTRLIFTGGFTLSAVVGVALLAPRLLSALKGGVGAPQLTEELKNFSITAGAAALLGFVFARDLQGQFRDDSAIKREESLGRLQLDLGNDRILPLASVRGRVRPVILAGSEAYLKKASEEAGKHRLELRRRGVSLVCLETKSADPGSALKALKAEFRQGGSQGFGEKRAGTPSKPSQSALLEADKRWKLEPHDKAEWEAWLLQQREAAKIKGSNLYLQVQLNGSVRGSGEGQPPWEKFLDDIPELDSIRTRFTDGLGR